MAKSVTKAELVANIASEAGLKKVQAEKALSAMTGAIQAALVGGRKVVLVGFGIVVDRVCVRAARLHVYAAREDIRVRVEVERGWGGFIKNKNYQLTIKDEVIPLSGEWKIKIGATGNKPKPPIIIERQPTALYNAMIAPLHRYPIKGVIWYQGEGNASRSEIYAAQFAAMIKDWRSRWINPDLPFLFVQLANFMRPDTIPVDSNWANLRAAQAQVDQALPNTGMAVAIDIGEWNNIHPHDKKTVGKRLALIARHIAYGETDIIYQGPTYAEMKQENNKLVISFDHTGSGLVQRGDQLYEFAIAGADERFVWANAMVTGNSVEVWHDNVQNPQYIRYAWSNNPSKANLYNREGLPAVPFSESLVKQ